MLPPSYRDISIMPTNSITVHDKVKFVYNSYEFLVREYSFFLFYMSVRARR